MERENFLRREKSYELSWCGIGSCGGLAGMGRCGSEIYILIIFSDFCRGTQGKVYILAERSLGFGV